MKTPKIIIIMGGGIIHQLMSDVPIDVCIVDYDVEGAESDRIIQIPSGVCIEDVYCTIQASDVDNKATNELWEFIENEFKIKENGQ